MTVLKQHSIQHDHALTWSDSGFNFSSVAGISRCFVLSKASSVKWSQPSTIRPGIWSSNRMERNSLFLTPSNPSIFKLFNLLKIKCSKFTNPNRRSMINFKNTSNKRESPVHCHWSPCILTNPNSLIYRGKCAQFDSNTNHRQSSNRVKPMFSNAHSSLY